MIIIRFFSVASVLFFSIYSWLSIDHTLYVDVIPIQDELKRSIQRGQLIYDDFCLHCHLADGKGQEGIIPPLANSDWLKNKRKESIHAVKYGQYGPIVVNGKKYNGAMPPMGLDDDEIADVMNYILNAWGNSSSKMVTEAEVRAVVK